MSLTNIADPGAPPLAVPNSYTASTGFVQKVETDIVRAFISLFVCDILMHCFTVDA